jgi:hypothetical protein
MEMERTVRSAARRLPVAPPTPSFLPPLQDTQRSTRRTAPPHWPFDARTLLTPIKRFVALNARGYSFYIHPTNDNRHTTLLGVSASRHAALYILLSQTGPYIRDTAGGRGGISLLTISDQGARVARR